MTDLTTLIAKLEAAKGPSRELDWMISDCFSYPHPFPESSVWPPFVKGSGTDKEIPSFTASIDAAVALSARVLPGWSGSVQFGNFEYQVTAYLGSDEDTKDTMAVHSSPAIALVIAILLAKQAEGKP